MEPVGQSSDASCARARAVGEFLSTLAATGNVSAAVRAARIARSTAYLWRAEDPTFASDWRDAEEVATDALEAEARRRAVEGWEEPVWHQGEQCGTVRRYSDRMLEILLKGHRKAFRENAKIEVSGPNGGPIPQDVRHDVSPQFAAEVGAILASIGVTVTAPASGDDRGPGAPQEPVGAPPPAPEAGGTPSA